LSNSQSEFISTPCRRLCLPSLCNCHFFEVSNIYPLYQSAIYSCKPLDDTFNAGDAAFLSSSNDMLRRYSTHHPDHGTIQFAGNPARTDTDGIYCDAGP